MPIQPRLPVWCVAAWPYEKSLHRAIGHDGIIPVNRESGADPSAPVSAETLQKILAWCNERRETDTPFDFIIESTTTGPDDTEYLQQVAEAGATWAIESRWDDDETVKSLTHRIRQGPPRV